MNNEMDVFPMNDATRLANMSFQGHGGFAQVLDPAGQVLLNSIHRCVDLPWKC